MRSLISRASGPQSLWDVMSEMERAFEQSFAPSSGRLAMFEPKVDLEETKDYYLLSFDLPGLSKDEVKIEVQDSTLSVSGKRERRKESESKGVRRLEREFGEFNRQFQLPRDIKGDNVEARFENGVLEVLIPKSEQAKARQVRISEGKGGLFSRLVGKSDEPSTH